TFDNSPQTVNGNGWVNVSSSTGVLSVNSGDVIAVSITFSAEIQGGSGNDDLRFRVRASGFAGCAGNNVSGGETDRLEVYREVRDHSVQTSIQHAFTATCNGNYSFVLQANLDDTDDDVVIDDIQITAVKY
ncbi:MAG: hypothetical protein H6603_11250, partial [Flavobacteriales bacterium]|nr:hypothetical protein [Flavobacteriales bacterium]